MDYISCDKKVISSLIEVLMTGVKNDCLSQSDALLASIRILRPKFIELETFDAWLLIKRKKYLAATYILRNLQGAGTDMARMPISTALLALCLYASNDPDWAISANEVLVRNEDPEAIALVNMLFGKSPEKSVQTEEPAEQAVSTAMTTATTDMMYTHYLRA